MKHVPAETREYARAIIEHQLVRWDLEGMMSPGACWAAEFRLAVEWRRAAQAAGSSIVRRRCAYEAEAALREARRLREKDTTTYGR